MTVISIGEVFVVSGELSWTALLGGFVLLSVANYAQLIFTYKFKYKINVAYSLSLLFYTLV